jgi:sphingomyelin phosphodiesterase acid-like 3
MPPGSDERQRGFPPAHSVYTDYHNKKYLELVRRYADIIVGQFFGHLHSDTFRVIYGERGKTTKTFFICNIQGVIEIYGIILTTSYWLHVELGKNI